MKSDRESSTYKTRRCCEQMYAKITSKLWLMSWNFKTIKQKISEHAIRDQQTCVTLLDMFPKLVFLSGFTVSKIFCLSKSKLSRFFFWNTVCEIFTLSIHAATSPTHKNSNLEKVSPSFCEASRKHFEPSTTHKSNNTYTDKTTSTGVSQKKNNRKKQPKKSGSNLTKLSR